MKNLCVSEMGRKSPPRINYGNNRFQDKIPVPQSLANERDGSKLTDQNLAQERRVSVRS